MLHFKVSKGPTVFVQSISFHVTACAEVLKQSVIVRSSDIVFQLTSLQRGLEITKLSVSKLEPFFKSTKTNQHMLETLCSTSYS